MCITPSSVAPPNHQREDPTAVGPYANQGRTQGVNCNEMLCGPAYELSLESSFPYKSRPRPFRRL
jgi:hypothetical protein